MVDVYLAAYFNHPILRFVYVLRVLNLIINKGLVNYNSIDKQFEAKYV